MKKILTLVLASTLAGFAAACSSSSETSNTTTPATATNSAPPNTTAESNTPKSAPGEEAPPNVRAAFPDAQSFTKQHKDLSASQIATIEKETNGKVPDTDHHSYLAFSSSGGTRKQIGAATIVKAAGKDVVVVYESRAGKPYIREVRAEGVPQSFLDQFKGKGHDEKYQIGGDLKAQGVDEATAKAIAAALRVDIMTMQTLYGAADVH